MKWLERLNILARIRRLESDFKMKREEMQKLVERAEVAVPLPEDAYKKLWGIWPEIYRLREISEGRGDS